MRERNSNNPNPELVKAKLLLHLQSCMYFWPGQCTPNQLNKNANNIIRYVTSLTDNKVKRDDETQEILTQLIYQIGTYQLYVAEDPHSVLFLMQSLEDKMTGNPLAWLRNHIVYGYVQLFIQAKNAGDNTLAGVYEKNIVNYANLLIEDYREAENDEEKQILAYIGFLTGLCDFQNKKYSHAIQNIEHGISVFQASVGHEKLTAFMKLHFTGPYSVIDPVQTKFIFKELKKYWEDASNMMDLQVIHFFKKYADFLVSERHGESKQKAYDLYQKAYLLLAQNPEFAPGFKTELKQRIQKVADILAIEKGQIVLFKPAMRVTPTPAYDTSPKLR